METGVQVGGRTVTRGEASSFVLTLLIFNRHRIRNILPQRKESNPFPQVLLLSGSSLGPQRGCGPASPVTDEETEAGEVRDLLGRTLQPTSDTNGTQTLSACLQSPHLVHVWPLDATWTTCSFPKGWNPPP